MVYYIAASKEKEADFGLLLINDDRDFPILYYAETVKNWQTNALNCDQAALSFVRMPSRLATFNFARMRFEYSRRLVSVTPTALAI